MPGEVSPKRETEDARPLSPWLVSSPKYFAKPTPELLPWPSALPMSSQVGGSPIPSHLGQSARFGFRPLPPQAGHGFLRVMGGT